LIGWMTDAQCGHKAAKAVEVLRRKDFRHTSSPPACFCKAGATPKANKALLVLLLWDFSPTLFLYLHVLP